MIAMQFDVAFLLCLPQLKILNLLRQIQYNPQTILLINCNISLMKKKNDTSPNKSSSPSKKINRNLCPPRKFKFYLGSRERYITISSDFDSGNIDVVRQISEFQYRLSSVHDGSFTDHRVNSKSWFFFSVVGFPANTKGKFIVGKVQTLQGMYYSKYAKSYRPVYRIGEQGQWNRIPTQAELVMREESQLECIFDFQFRRQNQKVYFAFCYPYTYTEHIKHINSLGQYLSIDQFYFHKEVFIRSPENRDIHLLTITSYDHQDKTCDSEQIFCEGLFPDKNRPLKFKKPVVFISARVHPGQTPASYAMKGVIDFLLKKDDLRAYLLRKMFVFMIVPMINVDGVYNGHFRMDKYGKNLNRYYINPCETKQPAIFAIKSLANHLNKDNRLSFYFDLHAHNAKKGCFIYGNAINDFVEQVESQVFCKLISMNNKGFQYQYCNFTQKHMNAKDRGQDMTKQGCGRVVMYRLAKIIHSYSVQCGIVSPNKLNSIPETPNSDFKIQNQGFNEDNCEDNSHPMYKTKNDENALFTPQMYENLGKNLLVSILDVFDKNPYNRVYNSKYKSMDMLRRITAFQIFHQAQRFRMFQRFVFGKVKNINELIREVLNTKLHYRKLYNFYFFDDKQLKNIQWPSNIPGLAKPKPPESPTRLKRFKSSEVGSSSQIQGQYSQSFMKALMEISTNKKEQAQQEQLIEKQQQIDDGKSSETQDFQPNTQTLQYIRNLQLMMEDPDIDEAQKIAIATKIAQLHSDQQIQITEQKLEEEDNDNQQELVTWKQIKLIQIKDDKQGTKNKKEAEAKDGPISFIGANEMGKFRPENHINQSTQFSIIKDNQSFQINSSERKMKESPAVRVRRILKQDFAAQVNPDLIKGRKAFQQSSPENEINDKEIEQIKKEQPIKIINKKSYRSSATAKTINSSNKADHELESQKKNVSSTGLQIRKNIYESIKHEIKEELKRQQYREKNKIYEKNKAAFSDRQDYNRHKNKQAPSPVSITVKNNQSNFSANPRICSPVKIQKQRIKSWSMKANRNSVGVQSIHSHINGNLSKNKLQLPSLGQQMYIISTSSKAFLKKN